MTAELEGELIDGLDRQRDEIVAFLQDFLREKSPNPPGDTRGAAAHITRFLEARGLPHRIIAPN
ncbi:MAG TPA: hypothetical protein VMM55_04155, partial [Thermohalobaculum sp.]|nr:hypothetical protein [Thermohalobaculum sp.]